MLFLSFCDVLICWFLQWAIRRRWRGRGSPVTFSEDDCQLNHPISAFSILINSERCIIWNTDSTCMSVGRINTMGEGFSIKTANNGEGGRRKKIFDCLCLSLCICESCIGCNLLQYCSGVVGRCSESSHLISLIRGSNESLTIDQCQGVTPLCHYMNVCVGVCTELVRICLCLSVCM